MATVPRAWWWLCASLGLFISFNSQAQQRYFNKSITETENRYQYGWIDKTGQGRELEFGLLNEELQKVPAVQPFYRPNVALRHVTVSLLKHARTINPKDARISIKQYRDQINIEVKANSPDKAQSFQSSMEELKHQALHDYITERFYISYVTPNQKPGIKPDHIRYIKLSTPALLPLSQALYEQLNSQSDAREYFNLMLSWLQSIPYDTLEDRLTSHGAGFSPPITLLNSNLGDCDSKAVLAASIIRAFLPNTPLVMVFLKNHALLGVASSMRDTDARILVNGMPYVLLDPTGPALMSLGQVSPSTANAIVGGAYIVETVPVVSQWENMDMEKMPKQTLDEPMLEMNEPAPQQ